MNAGDIGAENGKRGCLIKKENEDIDVNRGGIKN